MTIDLQTKIHATSKMVSVKTSSQSTRVGSHPAKSKRSVGYTDSRPSESHRRLATILIEGFLYLDGDIPVQVRSRLPK